MIACVTLKENNIVFRDYKSNTNNILNSTRKFFYEVSYCNNITNSVSQYLRSPK